MLRNEYVTYDIVSVLPLYSSDEYAGIVIFHFFLQRLLGFGVLLVARIVRLIQAEPDSTSYSLYRCFHSSRCLLATLVKPNLANGNQEQKVKECFAMTNWKK